MKRFLHAVLMAIVLIGTATAAFAGDVRTDYDHTASFTQYNSYSWGKVKTSNPFYVDRIQQAVNQQLQAKGWTLMPNGGSVTVFATDQIHNQQEVQTMYDGWGGGWGRGWGWGGWGWSGGWADPGPAMATTTTSNQPVSNLVIDLFEGSSKKLLWRGLATEDLSSNSGKNTKMVDSDIHNMFKSFPPKAGK